MGWHWEVGGQRKEARGSDTAPSGGRDGLNVASGGIPMSSSRLPGAAGGEGAAAAEVAMVSLWCGAGAGFVVLFCAGAAVHTPHLFDTGVLIHLVLHDQEPGGSGSHVTFHLSHVQNAFRMKCQCMNAYA